MTHSLLTGAEEIAWDLSDLYAGMDDPQINADLDRCDAEAQALREAYRGRIASLSAAQLAEMITAYEAIVERSGKVSTFAGLNWTQNTEDPARGALMQRAMERGSRLQQELVFVELELAAVDDEVAAGWLADPALARWRHWLETVRMFRPHLLSEPEERILAEKAVTGRNAWERFFDEAHSAARYTLDGQELTRDQVLNKLYAPDRDLRRRAAAAITEGLRRLQRTSTYVFNTILADKASDDRLRRYPTWLSSRNLANQVDDRTVDALIEAVTGRYDIVARYYRLKRRLLGLDELFDYDRYAPLPAADRFYPWDAAREVVLSAYGRFHPRMAEVASRFFDGRWIDAPPRPGKMGGAFSHGAVPSVHPYILLNYEGRPRDVMTLAHELGHGVHQKLAGVQGVLQADTPLTTAETASVFGEMLVFQDLMAQESDRAVRLGMLTSKIEDAFATAFRQISMNRFEHAIHTARREEGELTTEQFNALWLQTQRAMFGDSVTLTDDYGLWWSYIGHFISVPGYVYAYAFGQLLVLALYARYQQVGGDFADRYIALLTAGGSQWPHELVKPLGVDLTDPAFWNEGLNILEGWVAEAEALADGVRS
ncbi:MAG: M3 family oligoendopeptidase [Caldilineales bacterium]|nr:M3 family oligoendopeptidase [Caldilineales bacterium]MDW8316741.1 M3 family oligoendopeptidase [Anaerolineae bacterium]